LFLIQHTITFVYNNEVYWYRKEGSSIGFAPNAVTSQLLLNCIETKDRVEEGRRLGLALHLVIDSFYNKILLKI
jgi:hypothetical protein